jgi:AraC family transcriptional regulator, transcriptional activator of pobA
MVEVSSLTGNDSLLRPRRVMRYVMIWCKAGQMEICVDDGTYTLSGHDVITITSGQFHYVKRSVQADAVVLEFTLDFFCKDDHDVELIFHNGLFCHFGQNEVIRITDASDFDREMSEIARELANHPYQHATSVRARIALLLVMINRAKVSRGDEIWKPEALFLRFLEQVRSSFANSYGLEDYANLLNTTESKLNEQARKHAGKSAQSVINGLIIAEAKRLLMYEKLTVKEVANKVGFNDPFYFSNFFKKHAGVSPKQYQQEHH